MNHKAISEALGGIFMTVKREDGSEVRAFTIASMNEDSGLYPVYKAISEAMRASGLTFNFSYEVASKAVDILAESEDWSELGEAIDQAIPVYTAELMEIYQANSWAVDEAVKEMGGSEGDSNSRAITGWYVAIQNMVEAIKSNLEEIMS